MKKFIIISIIITSIVAYAIASVIESDNSLYLDTETTITPIIENTEQDIKYQYIRTLKVDYKDKLDKPIKLQNGDKLYNRCSYESQLIMYSESDSLVLNSWKRMSCEIVAFFNLELKDIEWLLENSIDKITIINITTNMNKDYKNHQPNYLKNLLTLYNKK